jgi:hypothetical protein
MMDLLWSVSYFVGLAGMLYLGCTVFRDITIMKRQLARIDTKCFDPES